MGEWLKGCEICNACLVAEMDELVNSGISVRNAAKLLADEGERKIGDLVYTEAAIIARYLLHKGKRDPHPLTKWFTVNHQKQQNKINSKLSTT
jgi:hypothetical protein